jgi:tetratricopeptide (TPR) repeat protein
MNPRPAERASDEFAADAYAWADLAETYRDAGLTTKSNAAILRAVELGPALPAILMRAAQHAIFEDKPATALSYMRRVLALSPEYDSFTFNYYLSQFPLDVVLKTGIPDSREPARRFFPHLVAAGTGARDLGTGWSWMVERGYADEEMTSAYVGGLYQRRDYAAAAAEYRKWAKVRDEAERLTNNRFEREPARSPFDWSVAPNPGVEYERGEGLTIRFLGKSNLSFANVAQMAAVAPGKYRLEAEVAGEGLTTNEGPFVRVQDAEDAGRLDAATEMVKGTRARGRVRVEFETGEKTRLVSVAVVRRPSQKFDNKIAGTLRVYGVWLRRIGS